MASHYLTRKHATNQREESTQLDKGYYFVLNFSVQNSLNKWCIILLSGKPYFKGFACNIPLSRLVFED